MDEFQVKHSLQKGAEDSDGADDPKGASDPDADADDAGGGADKGGKPPAVSFCVRNGFTAMLQRAIFKKPRRFLIPRFTHRNLFSLILPLSSYA